MIYIILTILLYLLGAVVNFTFLTWAQEKKQIDNFRPLWDRPQVGMNFVYSIMWPLCALIWLDEIRDMITIKFDWRKYSPVHRYANWLWKKFRGLT